MNGVSFFDEMKCKHWQNGWSNSITKMYLFLQFHTIGNSYNFTHLLSLWPPPPPLLSPGTITSSFSPHTILFFILQKEKCFNQFLITLTIKFKVLYPLCYSSKNTWKSKRLKEPDHVLGPSLLVMFRFGELLAMPQIDSLSNYWTPTTH